MPAKFHKIMRIYIPNVVEIDIVVHLKDETGNINIIMML